MSDDRAAQRHAFFAACPLGVTELLARELRALGIDVEREHPAGVTFAGALTDGYRACLQSRTASRVLLTLVSGDAATDAAFYAFVREVPWEWHIRADGTLAIDVVGEAPSWVRHTTFAAQRAKDAIVDRLQDRCGQRPSVDLTRPDVRVSVRFARARATVAIDLSGAPLHRRGYRQSAVEAPVKENLAAALLLRSGWPEIAAKGGAFADPMCGSGTFVIEAALIAANHAPGLFRRHFGFERWLGHDVAAWSTVRSDVESRSTLSQLEPGRFSGSDASLEAVRAALANVARAGLGERVTISRRSIEELTPTRFASGLVFVNPPYGARLGEVGELASLYRALGAALLRCYPGWEAGVFTGNPPLGRELGLRAHRVHTFYNGPIECRLLRFELNDAAREPDREQVKAERRSAARARPGAGMFANRLRKNLKQLEPWARREDVSCYRVYDADMPEYAFAIDLYGNAERHACVQEYEAPATVDFQAARSRREEALSVLEEALELPEERIHLKTRRRQRGGAQYEAEDHEGVFHEVREGANRFLVNFNDYLDTGLFLDHRLTRGLLAAKAAGRRFLNLFAYTGTATVCAVRGGATASTTVDMSRTYLDWARRNLALNGLASPAHVFVRADCLQWLDDQRERREREYDLVFVDPPTRSRSKRMQREFDVQHDHVELLTMVGALLAPRGEIVFSNNYGRFRLDRDGLRDFAVEDLTAQTIPRDFARNPRIHHCFVLRRDGETAAPRSGPH
jgi:23S rRNA (guanine2445-N2)-methyltransferase / 23S rRNA (guanine2069-N7)-methyltransferase